MAQFFNRMTGVQSGPAAESDFKSPIAARMSSSVIRKSSLVSVFVITGGSKAGGWIFGRIGIAKN